MGLKGRPSHRAEVSAMFPLPTPYGWRVYRQWSRQAVHASATGYATEADAWSAGGQALDQVITHQSAKMTARSAPSRSTSLPEPSNWNSTGASATSRPARMNFKGGDNATRLLSCAFQR
jgi:hypothetical protein